MNQICYHLGSLGPLMFWASVLPFVLTLDILKDGTSHYSFINSSTSLVNVLKPFKQHPLGLIPLYDTQTRIKCLRPP